ncbi:MAG: LON peptidase substrate-binding domain-containing protein [Planctomycetota bacterium]
MPLHIFEPRYRAMVRDALEGDRLIAMGLLAQCSRDEYRDKPPFHETVCVGHLLRHEELAGGKSNILLLGVSAGAAAFTQTTPGADDIDELRQYLGGLMDDRHIASGVVSACAITATIPPLYKLALLEERSLHRRLEKLVEYIERPWQWN